MRQQCPIADQRSKHLRSPGVSSSDGRLQKEDDKCMR